jgi:hypothetical protein
VNEQAAMMAIAGLARTGTTTNRHTTRRPIKHGRRAWLRPPACSLGYAQQWLPSHSIPRTLTGRPTSALSERLGYDRVHRAQHDQSRRASALARAFRASPFWPVPLREVRLHGNAPSESPWCRPRESFMSCQHWPRLRSSFTRRWTHGAADDPTCWRVCPLNAGSCSNRMLATAYAGGPWRHSKCHLSGLFFLN